MWGFRLLNKGSSEARIGRVMGELCFKHLGNKYIQKMADKGSADKFIKCSRCKCKYINDEDHIRNDFGYNRLGERFKNCMKCRESKNKWEADHHGYLYAKDTCKYCGATVSRKHLSEHEDTDKCLTTSQSKKVNETQSKENVEAKSKPN